MASNLETETVKVKIPESTVKDRDYVLQKLVGDLNNISINDLSFEYDKYGFDETTFKNLISDISGEIESKFTQYKQLPPLTKKKQSKPKHEKLMSYSGWMVFLQDEEQRNKFKDQVRVDGQYDLGTERKLMSAEWAKCDKDIYNEKAIKLNQLNLQKWKEVYERLHLETDQAEVLKQLESAEKINGMKKPELFHFIGITDNATNIEQATKINVLKKTLIEYLKESKDKRIQDRSVSAYIEKTIEE